MASIVSSELTLKEFGGLSKFISRKHSNTEFTFMKLALPDLITDQPLSFTSSLGTIDTLLIASDQAISWRQVATDTAIPIAANGHTLISGTSITAVLLSNSSGSTAQVTIGVAGTRTSWYSGATGQVAKLPFYNVTDAAYGAKGDCTDGSNGTDDTAAIQACIDAVHALGGGVVYFPKGRYRITDKLTTYDTVTLLGVGKDGSATGGGGSIIDGQNLLTTTPAVYGTGISDVHIRDLYIYASKTGSGAGIKFAGTCRNVNIERCIVNKVTATTGSCVDLCDSGSLQVSCVRGLITNAGLYGITVGNSCTSITLQNCYMQSQSASGGAGYNILGYYITLLSCAVDGSYWGYLLDSANTVSLLGCGSEGSLTSAVVLHDTNNVNIDGFFSYLSNVNAGVTTPSFLDIRNSDFVTVLNPQDDSPNAATVSAISSMTSDAGSSITVISPNFTLPIDPSANATIISKGFVQLPLVTTTAKNLLTAVNGMIVYDTTLNKFQGYENGSWASLI